MKVYINKIIPEIAAKLLGESDIEVIQDDQKENCFSNDLMLKADAFLNVGGIRIDTDFYEKFPNIRAISLFSVGFNHVNIPAAVQRKIPVGNTPDVLSRATSDVAFLLMQMVARYASANLEKVKSGNWKFFNPLENLGQELYGKTLGIYGLGRIGFEMAKKCRAAFGMDIIYHNRRRNELAEQQLDAKLVTFDGLLNHSDVLSIHANFSEENLGLFGEGAFSKMKKDSIIINTARGGFIDENALYFAIKNGKIFGAGLDVTFPEPCSPANPLLDLPSVCIFPHIGSATRDARSGMAKIAAENLIAFRIGKPMPHCINPEVYDSFFLTNS